MAPYQTTVMLDDAREGQDVVEVQILPQVIVVLRYIFFCKTKIFFHFHVYLLYLLMSQ